MELANGAGTFRGVSTLGFGVMVEIEIDGMGMGLCVSTRDARAMVNELNRAITQEENSNASNQPATR